MRNGRHSYANGLRFKHDLEECVAHWNTWRRQVRLKGLTPEEFRNQALAA